MEVEYYNIGDDDIDTIAEYFLALGSQGYKHAWPIHSLIIITKEEITNEQAVELYNKYQDEQWNATHEEE